MLEPILQATRRRIAGLDGVAARAEAAGGAPAKRFAEAMARPGLQVIAEIKRRSPSAGVLAADLDPVVQATAYVTGGAAAISVLTEPEFFAGSLDDLRAVRAAVDVPVLRKDFILDEAQVWEARAAGADAVLLIVAALPEDRLARLLAVAEETGMDALVEVHTAAEVEVARRAGAKLVGVNNRDLTSFHTDLATAEGLADLLGTETVRIAESGVSDPAGAGRMAAAGYDGILVGEALVRAADPAGLIGELKAAS